LQTPAGQIACEVSHRIVCVSTCLRGLIRSATNHVVAVWQTRRRTRKGRMPSC